MASKTSRESPQGSMTPMIDVVFQLLIFFVVTLKQDDILSRLKAARPANDPNVPVESDPKVIDITVHKGGFILKGAPMTIEGLDRRMAKYASMSTSASVVVRCTADSPHALLVQCLDVCSKHKMTSLSIFSM